MRFAIGFWIIGLALAYLFVIVLGDGCFKERIKTAFGCMVFLTLVILGAYLMVGV